MTFLDLFSGIGGFRLAMEQAGHVCVGHCEIDKYANESYIAMHRPRKGEWYADDITRVRAEDMPRADCWCFGFPCQDISIAGKQRGFAGQRSSLFFTVTGLIRGQAEEDRPSYLLIENVKNLLSINGGVDFARLLMELDEIGYDAEWSVLNTSDVLPQNRERLFIVGHFRGRSTRKVFPIGKDIEKPTNGIKIVGSIKPKKSSCFGQRKMVYSVLGISGCLCSSDYKEPKKVAVPDKLLKTKKMLKLIGLIDGENKQANRIYSLEGISPTLTTGTGGRHEPKFILFDKDGYRVRKLTPCEYFRLQGFPDDYFDRARAVCSDSQLYKQAGNSVTVPVVYEIAKRMEIGNKSG